MAGAHGEDGRRRGREGAARGDGVPADLTNRLAPALAAALGALVYLGALRNPFVYDDHATILSNPSLVHLANWRFVLVYSLFRPVVNVSYAIDRAVWGFNPLGFHLTNLLLHLVNVVLVHRLVWHAAGDAAARRHEPPAGRSLVAFATAAIFAVHPLLTEAVGYVSGRSEVLCATFVLAALLLVRRWLAGGAWPWLAGGLAAFGLALGAKEVAAVFPFLLLAYDWLLAGGAPDARRRRLWRLHLPLVAVVVAAGTARLATLAAEPTASGFRSAWTNALTQVTVVVRYLGMLIVPAGQSIAHAVPAPPSILAVAGAAVLLGVIVRAAYGVRRQLPLATFGVAWFLLLLVPSSAVPLREPMAEHRVYLASMGVFLIAGMLLGSGRLKPAPTPAGKKGPPPVRSNGWRTGVLGVMLAMLGWLTVARIQVWASPVSLWSEAAAAAPGAWEPHYQLADALRERGQCAQAVGQYRIVTRLRPDDRDAFNNLGICLAQTRRPDAARQAFERALAIDPSFVRAHNNLGGLAILTRDPEEARRQFERSLALDPANIVARRQLASLFETVFHDPAEAARLCREIVAIDPASPGAAECVARNEAKLRQVK